jgi:hypothetical protein
MKQTPFSDRVEILAVFWLVFRDLTTEDEGWVNFFIEKDVGLPLAYIISRGYAEQTIMGETLINQTWIDFCAALQVDPDGYYADLTALFDASPNELLESPEEED